MFFPTHPDCTCICKNTQRPELLLQIFENDLETSFPFTPQLFRDGIGRNGKREIFSCWLKFPKWLQQSDLIQANASSQEIHQCLPHGQQEHKYFYHPPLLSCHQKQNNRICNWYSNIRFNVAGDNLLHCTTTPSQEHPPK